MYRITGNAGHTGTFSWLNRSRLCIQNLKQRAERYASNRGQMPSKRCNLGIQATTEEPMQNQHMR